ncbi:DDT domain-containing protein PTM-like [Silene latifolia]|uniref:DDT domain-containing protein PTM-like n=1 Tax=Silene latifolia TaxID=37657 RepID=UPI003D780B8C
METPVVKSRGRPRKRRREEDSPTEVVEIGIVGGSIEDGKEDGEKMGNSRKRGRPPKKRAVEMRGEAMIGRYVLKKFDGSGTFLGKIVSYDSGLYRVDYEDGDCEDLDSGELREFVIGDERQRFVGELLERRNKLDDSIEKRSVMKLKEEPGKDARLKGKQEVGVNLKEEATKVDSVEVVCALQKVDEQNAGNVLNDSRKTEVSEFPGEDVSGSDIDDNDEGDKDEDYCFEDDDDDSSDDSCEYGLGWETRADTEIPAILPPELPPSSGTIGVPEEYVSHLFSVHGFLRTFSVHLFLSPFTLDDLVGCLKCSTPNTLLDAIHVALLRVLRRHLESLVSEGSQLASKCMRAIDWSLLDNLTWPVYLVHYLIAMGHLNGSEWKAFYIDALEKEYCTLSIETKLTVLQILCDDVLDAEEIRSEIDTREESEVGVDSDVSFSNPFDKVTRHAYPRNSKTFVGKDRDNSSSVTENSVFFGSKTVKSEDHNLDTDDVGEDGNRDECRLCGMEGMLICCDGCPSAYHSRCIGVNKLSIPDGEWFCPECTIGRIGPPINSGTSLRGAEVFGVDSYAQLFLGTCSHLLVLKVSLKASSFVRYYNRNDVPTVLSVLCSSPYHSISYLGICQAISKYWELPQPVVSPLMINQSMVVDNKDDYRLLSFQPHLSAENRNEEAPYNYATGVGESSIHDASGLGNGNLKSGSDSILLGEALQNDPKSMLYSSVSSMRQNATNVTSVLSELAELCRSTQVGLADQSTTAEIAVCTSGYATGTSHKNGVCFPESYHLQVGEVSVRTVGKTFQKKDTCLYMGSIFKPLAYVNNYVHGAFAASAVANFAGLSSDENQASEIHASDPRKAMAANVSLQAKAFSSAAVRFFWPSTVKKLVEIPRERCSWCFHCKAPVTSKKACLLNQAALNATRAEMKFISGLRLEKIVDGGLYGIAAYTLFMEESFRGLTVGPFRSLSYREQWRKKVEQASACCEIKSLLLELERNLCSIAVSSEWTKLVDTWMDESPVPQSAAASGPVQKRGPGKRKKNNTIPEAADDDPIDSKELCWWRGGKLAKFVFQKGIFPSRVIRKAARQGGSKRLLGIYYADGSDVPKRSRQFIWRAAVEMAKNASQLALQVRYLDQHIKWSDVVRPEQNAVEGKGPETEAFAFRNARICDKRITENKILYGIVFGSQKHLSSRLMKSIIEKEECEDGNLKYWFLEARVPLYLVKEYEEKAETTDLSPPVKPDRFTKRQRRQLKASRKDIFVYLSLKRDGLHVCPCASCHTDALLELAVTCNTCEGYCHKTCMLSSTELVDEDIEFRAICKQCSQRKFLCQSNNSVESPISPLAMQGQEFQNSAVVPKSGKLKSSGQHQNSTTAVKSLKSKNCTQQFSSVGTSNKRSKSGSKSSKGKSSKSKTSKSERKASLCHGLIWKKKSSNDDGSDFRLRNIIFRGSSEGLTLQPKCHLCQKTYSPNLMYIRCEAICENWYHADAVKLDESKLPELFGFKCCKCRRIKSPTCPYEDPKKTEVRKLLIRGPKEETVDANSLSEATSDQADSLASTPLSLIEIDEEEDDMFTEADDPLLMSVSKIDQMPDPNSEPGFDQNSFVPGPQKLPVRRQMQSEKDDDGLTWTDFSSVQLPTSDETKNFADPKVEWDICNGGVQAGPSLNCDGFNYESDYEPQTYFSFTELLENDGDNPVEGVDASSGGWNDIAGEYSLNGFMEHCNVSSFDSLLEAKAPIEPSAELRCEVCQVATPAPDLACHMCGIQIHRHCSPWDDVFPGGLWSCGQCREWS